MALEFLLILVVLAVVVAIVAQPLRAGRAGRVEEGEDPVVAELEAERDVKYAEIRDAEMDHRTGKLSDEDYAAVSAALRAEAVEILRKLDAATAAAARTDAATGDTDHPADR